MFVINEDKSIYITRGDVAFFSLLVKTETGETHKFQAGDVIRFKVYEKKACENVVLSKDFGIEAETEEIEIYLAEKDTKIGDVISKPVDYWYEVELNPYTDPQTILGYDEDGAKVFKLFPEGNEKEDDEPITPEDIPVVDVELDLTSTRPVQNQAIARAVANIKTEVQNELIKHSDEIDASIGGRIDEEIDSRIGESLDAKIDEEMNAKVDEMIITKIDEKTANLDEVIIGKIDEETARFDEEIDDRIAEEIGKLDILPVTDITNDFMLSKNEAINVVFNKVYKQGNVINGTLALASPNGIDKAVDRSAMFKIKNDYLPAVKQILAAKFITDGATDPDGIFLTIDDSEGTIEAPIKLNIGFRLDFTFTYICK